MVIVMSYICAFLTSILFIFDLNCTNNHLASVKLTQILKLSVLFSYQGSSLLKELEDKLSYSQFNVPHTRKSLVKGERFIRYVWRTWVKLTRQTLRYKIFDRMNCFWLNSDNCQKNLGFDSQSLKLSHRHWLFLKFK